MERHIEWLFTNARNSCLLSDFLQYSNFYWQSDRLSFVIFRNLHITKLIPAHPPLPPTNLLRDPSYTTDAVHLWNTILGKLSTAWSILFVCFQQSPQVLHARCVSSAWQSGHMGRHGSRSEKQTREQVKCGSLYHFLSSFIVKFTSCRVR